MNAIFVDTWAWYALVDTQETDHLVAQLANEEFKPSPLRTVPRLR